MSKIIIEDHKYYTKCKVVMLPTEKATNSKQIFKHENGLNFNENVLVGGSSHPWFKPQHLYILSDEEIKEGDWVCNTFGKIVVQASSVLVDCINEDILVQQNHKKIIACTDSELKIDTEIFISGQRYKSLPNPSNSFLKSYCETEGVDKVLVEYEYKVGDQVLTHGNSHITPSLKLKVQSDNTIIIKLVKETYNTEELISKLWRFNQEALMIAGCATPVLTKDSFDKWVKENL